MEASPNLNSKPKLKPNPLNLGSQHASHHEKSAAGVLPPLAPIPAFPQKGKEKNREPTMHQSWFTHQICRFRMLCVR